MTAPGWVRWWYRGAAVYGLLALLPQYHRAPVPRADVATYGFIGTAAAFQLVFLVIASDPVRFRALMPVSVVEKLAFALPVAVLFWLGKVPAAVLAIGAIDLGLGVSFALAWVRTPRG